MKVRVHLHHSEEILMSTCTCLGAQASDGTPLCDGPDVRDVAFRPYGTMQWQRARWCADCRDLARNGAGLEIATFSEHIGSCTACNRRFRATEEQINASGLLGEMTAAAIVAAWEYCLGCVACESPDGEYDVPPTVHELLGLAEIDARDVFAIHAALVVACDDEPINGGEYFPGLKRALEKVSGVVSALRLAGEQQLTEDNGRAITHVSPPCELASSTVSPAQLQQASRLAHAIQTRDNIDRERSDRIARLNTVLAPGRI
jgi:hypothetical protein